MAKEKITAQRIRSARRAVDLTQGELADKCQINRVTVSAWERGLYKPEGDVLKKLAFILGVPEEYILGRSEADAVKSIEPIEPIDMESHFFKIPILSRLRVDRCKNKTVLADLAKAESENFLFWPCDAFKPHSNDRPPFAIKAAGDCMTCCGIYDGDTVIINPAEEPVQGSAVLVWLFGISSMVYYYRRPNGDVVLSRGEERQHEISIEEIEEEGFEVIGSIVGSIRQRPMIRQLFFDKEKKNPSTNR